MPFEASTWIADGGTRRERRSNGSNVGPQAIRTHTRWRGQSLSEEGGSSGEACDSRTEEPQPQRDDAHQHAVVAGDRRESPSYAAPSTPASLQSVTSREGPTNRDRRARRNSTWSRLGSRRQRLRPALSSATVRRYSSAARVASSVPAFQGETVYSQKRMPLAYSF